MISGMVACRYWLALKLHFTTRRYDFFEHKGKIKNFDEETYLARKDFKQFERIAKKYGDKVHEFFIANLLIGNKSIWDNSQIDSGDVYYNWVARTSSRAYHLKKDLGRHDITSLSRLIEITTMVDETCELFNMFKCGSITPETIVLLDNVHPFLVEWDNVMQESVLARAALVLLKYKSFIKKDDEVLNNILRMHNLL